MAMHGPACLTVGTEVSAKYRGAFCEAKVKKVNRVVKCKVSLKEGGPQITCPDDEIKGALRVGAVVEVKHPESGQSAEGTIMRINDQSMYTVVFDDGDENTLRRTQLCMKGEKHFVKSDTLDDLPLTNPEHFGTPVMRSSKGSRKRRSAMSNMFTESDSDVGSSSDDEGKRRVYRGRLQDLVGRVVCVEIEDRKKTAWVPGLIVQPEADDTALKTREHLLIKSFKDSKFYAIARRDTKEFTRDTALKCEDKTLKAVYEKALQYYDTRELPANWDRNELLGSESDVSETDSSDDEPSEEKDRFVAQLYNFMEDRGTPINKAPVLANRDLNLYRLFRVVQNLGGCNRVTNQMKWHLVYSKMNLPSTATAANQIKAAYKKYLHAFEDFYRKLGSTMGTISRHSRSRHSSGRSMLSFRDRESPRSPRSRSRKEEYQDESDEQGLSSKPATPSMLDVDKEDVREASKERVVPDKPEMKKTRAMAAAAATEELVPRRSPLVKDDTEGDSDVSRKSTRKHVEEEKKKMVSKEDKEVISRPSTREDAARQSKEDVIKMTRSMKDATVVKKVEEEKKSGSKERECEKEQEDNDEARLLKRRGKRKDDEVSETASVEKMEEIDVEDCSNENDEGIEYPIGTKLKVKYGRGKNIKLYGAKVLETRVNDTGPSYKVHYAGWNVRYDEWVKKERVFSVVEEVSSKKGLKAKALLVKAKQALTPGGLLKTQKPSSSSGPSQKHLETRASKVYPPGGRSPGQASSPTPSSKPSRPTRSTSTEVTLASGLPTIRKRLRRLSGMLDSPEEQGSDIDSDIDVTEDDEDEQGGPSDMSDMDEEEEDSVSLEDDKTAITMPSPHRDDLSASPSLDMKEKKLPFIMDNKFEKDPDATVKEKKQPDAEIHKSDVVDEEKDARIHPTGPWSDVGDDEEIQLEDSDLQDLDRDPFEFEDVSSERQVLRHSREPKVVPTVPATKTKDVVPEKVSDVAPSITDSPTRRSRLALAEVRVAELMEKSKPALDISHQVKKNIVEETIEEVATPKRKSKLRRQPSNDSHESISKPESSQSALADSKEIPVSEDHIPETQKQVESDKREEKVKKSATVDWKGDKAKKSKAAKIPPSEETPDKNLRVKPGPKPGWKKRKAELEAEAVQASSSPSRQDEADKPKKKTRKKKVDQDMEAKDTVKTEPGEIDICIKVEDARVPALVPPTGAHTDLSPPYGPAPQLTAPGCLKVETKPEGGDIDEPAPHLSPIPGVSTVKEKKKEDVDKRQGDTAFTSEPSGMDMVLTAPENRPTTVTSMMNTPPSTPESSVGGEDDLPLMPSKDSIPKEEDSTTKSELEANMEVEKLMSCEEHLPLGGESPNACDTSTISNGSGGSSGNAPGSESESNNYVYTTPNTKRKVAEDTDPEDSEKKPAKRKRRGAKCEKLGKRNSKQAMSDSDEGEQSHKSVTDRASPCNSSQGFDMSSVELRPSRPSKYNFLDLEEGKYLEGDDRINFLSGKIQDIRKLYMQLKSEVACIDRRRKKHRRREREAAQTLAFAMNLS